MAMTAAQTHSARGTKHTCGNDECGKRFYDLNRSPLDCPYCGVTLDLEAVVPRHQFAMEPGKKTRSKYYKLAAPAPEEAEEAPAQEADADTDGDTDETTADADTSTILIEDDETDATTDDVIDKPQGDDDAS